MTVLLGFLELSCPPRIHRHCCRRSISCAAWPPGSPAILGVASQRRATCGDAHRRSAVSHTVDPDDGHARLLPVARRDRSAPRDGLTRRSSKTRNAFTALGLARAARRLGLHPVEAQRSHVVHADESGGQDQQGPAEEAFGNWANLKIVLLSLLAQLPFGECRGWASSTRCSSSPARSSSTAEDRLPLTTSGLISRPGLSSSAGSPISSVDRRSCWQAACWVLLPDLASPRQSGARGLRRQDHDPADGDQLPGPPCSRTQGQAYSERSARLLRQARPVGRRSTDRGRPRSSRSTIRPAPFEKQLFEGPGDVWLSPGEAPGT